MAIIGRLNKYATIQAKEFDETTGNVVSLNSNGTFYSSDFVENIGISEVTIFSAFELLDDVFAITPSIKYDPTLKLNRTSYDILNDDFGITYDSSMQSGTYMSRDKYNSIIIYNEIDEVSSLN